MRYLANYKGSTIILKIIGIEMKYLVHGKGRIHIIIFFF